MKNIKIVYILIGVFCVLAVIAGIYAQFFVPETEKNNVIMPDFNNTQTPEVTEKTQEELKTQFASLFTNTFNIGTYNTANIERIDITKDLVYSDYAIEEQVDHYEVNIHLPVMNISNDVVAEFNNTTQTIFANKAAEILNSQSTQNTIYSVDYTAYINGDVLSLVIQSTLKEGNNPQRVIVQTYNYNLATGEKVEATDLLSQKNLIQSEVQNKIEETVQKAQQEAEILVQSGYSVYNRNLENQMYQLNNLSTYFLGPTGDLYIIFAYGNNNFTSEMDIVWYE